MRLDVVTLFPDLVKRISEFGVTGRAVENGLVDLRTWNPRDYAGDRHRTVDDRPYGGGPGMVMKVEPLRDAIRDAKASEDLQREVVFLSPQGEAFTQDLAKEFVATPGLVLVAGRYEGVDERLVEMEVDREVSLGDFVMSGGEIAALAIIDAVTRLLPGALGDDDSAAEDSFMHGLLDFPHYTRPEIVDGKRVPEVLLNGNHEAIRRWRLKHALGRTWLRRPDLIKMDLLDQEQKMLLEEFIAEQSSD